MNIDLNEENYDYQKILNLFSLEDDFNEKDLKMAKRKVLKLHPDKCQLDIKYYLFFSKMYKKIEQIYLYVHHETDMNNLKRTIDIDDHFKTYLERKNINPKTNFKAFSKEFNKMFDSVYVAENKDGHEDWLKSEDGIYDKNDIEASRKKAIAQQALVKRDEIEEVGGSADLFSKLKCFDVKESHSNSVIALDIEKEYMEKPKFKSVQEYQQFLAKEDTSNTPIGLEQSQMLLRKRETMLNQQAKNLAFQKMDRSENMDKNYNSYISKYLKLENGG